MPQQGRQQQQQPRGFASHQQSGFSPPPGFSPGQQQQSSPSFSPPQGQQTGFSPPPGFAAPPQNGSDMGAMLQALTNSSLMTAASVREMQQVMTQNYQATQDRQGYRQLKPKREVTKVTAADERTLVEELMNFELDLQELGVTDLTETAFFQLRAVSEGQAKDVVELTMLDPYNRMLHQQGLNSPNGPRFYGDGSPGTGYQRQTIFGQLYIIVIQALRQAY